MTRIPGLFSPFYIVFTPVSGLTFPDGKHYIHYVLYFKDDFKEDER